MHIVCNHCRRVNRGEPLLNPEPVQLDASGFVQFIVRNDLPVLVDFWAPWCGPCRAMAPQLSAAADKLKGRVLFAKLNTDSHPHIATQFQIRTIPTMVLFRAGNEVDRRSGVMSSQEMGAWIEAAI